jgi:hypothetical protein
MPSWSGAPDRAMPRNRVIAVPAAKHRLQAGVPIPLLREDDLGIYRRYGGSSAVVRVGQPDPILRVAL